MFIRSGNIKLKGSAELKLKTDHEELSVAACVTVCVMERVFCDFTLLLVSKRFTVTVNIDFLT